MEQEWGDLDGTGKKKKKKGSKTHYTSLASGEDAKAMRGSQCCCFSFSAVSLALVLFKLCTTRVNKKLLPHKQKYDKGVTRSGRRGLGQPLGTGEGEEEDDDVVEVALTTFEEAGDQDGQGGGASGEHPI